MERTDKSKRMKKRRKDDRAGNWKKRETKGRSKRTAEIGMWFRGFRTLSKTKRSSTSVAGVPLFFPTTNCEQKHRREYCMIVDTRYISRWLFNFNYYVEAVPSSYATRNRAYNCWLETEHHQSCPLCNTKHRCNVGYQIFDPTFGHG